MELPVGNVVQFLTGYPQGRCLRKLVREDNNVNSYFEELFSLLFDPTTAAGCGSFILSQNGGNPEQLGSERSQQIDRGSGESQSPRADDKPYQQGGDESREANDEPFQQDDGQSPEADREPFQQDNGQSSEADDEPFQQGGDESREADDEPFQQDDGRSSEADDEPFQQDDGRSSEADDEPFQQGGDESGKSQSLKQANNRKSCKSSCTERANDGEKKDFSNWTKSPESFWEDSNKALELTSRDYLTNIKKMYRHAIDSKKQMRIKTLHYRFHCLILFQDFRSQMEEDEMPRESNVEAYLHGQGIPLDRTQDYVDILKAGRRRFEFCKSLQCGNSQEGDKEIDFGHLFNMNIPDTIWDKSSGSPTQRRREILTEIKAANGSWSIDSGANLAAQAIIIWYKNQIRPEGIQYRVEEIEPEDISYRVGQRKRKSNEPQDNIAPSSKRQQTTHPSHDIAVASREDFSVRAMPSTSTSGMHHAISTNPVALTNGFRQDTPGAFSTVHFAQVATETLEPITNPVNSTLDGTHAAPNCSFFPGQPDILLDEAHIPFQDYSAIFPGQPDILLDEAHIPFQDYSAIFPGQPDILLDEAHIPFQDYSAVFPGQPDILLNRAHVSSPDSSSDRRLFAGAGNPAFYFNVLLDSAARLDSQSFLNSMPSPDSRENMRDWWNYSQGETHIATNTETSQNTPSYLSTIRV